MIPFSVSHIAFHFTILISRNMAMVSGYIKENTKKGLFLPKKAYYDVTDDVFTPKIS